MHDRAGQTGRTGGRQAEEALPGWACLGRIHAGGRNLFGKRGETDPERDGDPDQNHYKWVRPTGHPAGPLARVPEH